MCNLCGMQFWFVDGFWVVHSFVGKMLPKNGMEI
jgi:hypothetical protein